MDMNESQKAAFDSYLKELVAWNSHTNLTAIREPEEITKKHFEDSLSILQAIPESAQTLVDIGSGAGFPGIPVKIMRPDLYVLLVDSVAKKVAFLDHVITTLSLDKAEAIHARAEELGQDPELREAFDVVTARAVAHLSTLAEYALPLVQMGGIFIAQKIGNDNELEDAKNAIEILGGKVKEIIPVQILDLEPRQIIVIEKIKETPIEYPRRTGLPLKKPL